MSRLFPGIAGDLEDAEQQQDGPDWKEDDAQPWLGAIGDQTGEDEAARNEQGGGG